METNRQPTVTYLREVCFHITWKAQSYLHEEATEKKSHGIFYSRLLLLFYISCREQWLVLPPETVDYRQRQSRFKKGATICAMLPFLMFVFSQQSNNTKQTFNDTVNESVQAHDIGIFPACFPLKIKWRKMCLEATSFYLLVMVREKITKLWQKREIVHRADIGTVESFHFLSL